MLRIILLTIFIFKNKYLDAKQLRIYKNKNISLYISVAKLKIWERVFPPNSG